MYVCVHIAAQCTCALERFRVSESALTFI